MSAFLKRRWGVMPRVITRQAAMVLCGYVLAILVSPLILPGQEPSPATAVVWGNASAIVTWTTAVPATSLVFYGTSATALTRRASTSTLTTTHSVILTGLTSGATYYYAVTSLDAAGNSITSPLARRLPSSFVASSSLWDPSAAPATAAENDPGPVELGMRFESDLPGKVAGVRFYKGSKNTGTHVGHLWTVSGTLLASATFTNETASGWQQASFATPVSIAANTAYVISYHAANGYYSSDENYFAAAAAGTPPLRALQNDSSSRGNGLYLYGSDGFPTQTGNGRNYWVDVVFVPSTPVAPSPTAASIWPSAPVPGTISGADSNPVELGLKFQADVAGEVTGVRFYKGPENTGMHQGRLWSADGLLLATATFTNESESGWQQTAFTNPVAVQPNTTYVVSYFAPAAHYSLDADFFTQAEVYNPPLHALSESMAGGNGVYAYGAGSFPSQSDRARNYWVDVMFRALPSPADSTRASSTSTSATTKTTDERASEDLTPGTVEGGSSNRSVFTDGTAGGQHCVRLKWRASLTPDVAAYNIYRGLVSGGPYTLINRALVPQTTYTDTNVIGGQTYYYVTTAIDINFNESLYSNEAAATVPTTSSATSNVTPHE